MENLEKIYSLYIDGTKKSFVSFSVSDNCKQCSYRILYIYFV